MKRNYFGTDGVRGPYGGPLINESFAARLGLAAGRWLRAGGERRTSVVKDYPIAVERRELSGIGRVFIGRDTRFSGAALEAAVAHGLRAAGAEEVAEGDATARHAERREGVAGGGGADDQGEGDGVEVNQFVVM